MRIAIISDLHGNLAAFESVLKHIDSQNISQIYCAGDFVDPFKESVEVWSLLQQKGIPCLRGNHEDYVWNYFSDQLPKHGWLTFNQSTIKQVSLHIGKAIAKELASLPLDMEMKFPDGEVLYLCHASPDCNFKSHLDEFTLDRKKFFKQHSASLFVSGHKHFHDVLYLESNQVVVIGSLGMPLNQDTRAQYITVERSGGKWIVQHHRVEYDNILSFQRFLEDDWMLNAGGMGLLMGEQLLNAEDRLSPFVRWLKTRRGDPPECPNEWTREAVQYLKFKNAFASIQKHLPKNYFAEIGIY